MDINELTSLTALATALCSGGHSCGHLLFSGDNSDAPALPQPSDQRRKGKLVNNNEGVHISFMCCPIEMEAASQGRQSFFSVLADFPHLFF